MAGRRGLTTAAASVATCGPRHGGDLPHRPAITTKDVPPHDQDLADLPRAAAAADRVCGERFPHRARGTVPAAGDVGGEPGILPGRAGPAQHVRQHGYPDLLRDLHQFRQLLAAGDRRHLVLQWRAIAMRHSSYRTVRSPRSSTPARRTRRWRPTPIAHRSCAPAWRIWGTSWRPAPTERSPRHPRLWFTARGGANSSAATEGRDDGHQDRRNRGRHLPVFHLRP